MATIDFNFLSTSLLKTVHVKICLPIYTGAIDAQPPFKTAYCLV